MSTASDIPKSAGPDTPEAARQGCAYVFGGTGSDAAAAAFCDAPRRRGSAYCSRHHALCHLAPDSLAETRQLRAIEALAEAVGGKRSRPGRLPPPRLLRRLDRVARAAFSHPQRSRNVLEEGCRCRIAPGERPIPARRKTVGPCRSDCSTVRSSRWRAPCRM